MVEPSKRGRTLLKRLCAGETLIEIRCRWSSWYIDKGENPAQRKHPAIRRQVIGWVAAELNATGMVERVDDRAFIHSMGAFYECFRYFVTDAGRAAVTSSNAPMELT